MAVRAAAGGAQGQVQSGNDTPEKLVAVGSDDDRAAVEESADGGRLGDTAREHSDAVTQKAALPLHEGETDMKSLFLLQAEHGRRNRSALLHACLYYTYDMTRVNQLFSETPHSRRPILFVSPPQNLTLKTMQVATPWHLSMYWKLLLLLW